MARRIVDISAPLEAGIKSDPDGLNPEIEYFGHQDTRERVVGFFPGMTPDDLPDGEGWAFEKVRISTHNGTHLDAPWHFHSTMNHALTPGGEKAWTIDEVPLDWCYRPGVKLDFRHMEHGYVATTADVQVELQRIGHTLCPLDIVVVNTAAGARYGYDDYTDSGCGMGREATLWLLEQGVRVTGTDGWSWDAPFSATARRYAENPDPSIVWEGHRVGRDIGYCHIEKLNQLEDIPATGFEISCFPVKIKAASAGWCRAVAIFED